MNDVEDTHIGYQFDEDNPIIDILKPAGKGLLQPRMSLPTLIDTEIVAKKGENDPIKKDLDVSRKIDIDGREVG